MSAVATPTRGQLPLAPDSPDRLVPERPRRERMDLERRLRRESRVRPPVGGGLTLGQQLERAWEGLSAAGEAACPVCGGEMEPAGGAGRCGSCGSVLS